jgi:hypothetical protein
MPLARLCGSDRKAQIANEIRYDAVVFALARGVSPFALDEKLVHSFFHAQPWIDGVATRSLCKMVGQS